MAGDVAIGERELNDFRTKRHEQCGSEGDERGTDTEPDLIDPGANDDGGDKQACGQRSDNKGEPGPPLRQFEARGSWGGRGGRGRARRDGFIAKAQSAVVKREVQGCDGGESEQERRERYGENVVPDRARIVLPVEEIAE